MRIMVTGITSAALLVHTLLGCCGHHDHETAQSDPAVEVSHHALHDHDHAGRHHESQPGEHSGDLPGCDCPACVFIVAASPRLECDWQSGQIGWVAISQPLRVDVRDAGNTTLSGRFVDHDVGPAARTHLLHCRLLI